MSYHYYGNDEDLGARQEADEEQAELEAQGREHGRRLARVKVALAAGEFSSAAIICSHSWSGRAPDGHARECYHCGARISETGQTIEPGAFRVRS